MSDIMDLDTSPNFRAKLSIMCQDIEASKADGTFDGGVIDYGHTCTEPHAPYGSVCLMCIDDQRNKEHAKAGAAFLGPIIGGAIR